MTKKFDLAKLFSDPNAVPDDFEIKLGDAVVTMGDIRAYDAQRGGDVLAEVKRQQAALASEKAELQKASERVADTYVKLEAEKLRLAGVAPTTVTTTNDPLAAYEKDPVFGPVMQHMKSRETALEAATKALDAKLDAVNKLVGQVGMSVTNEKATRDFREIMSGDDPVRPTDISLDSLYKLAVERNIRDRAGLPDIKTAYNELTRDARHKHELEQARADERTKIETERAEAAMLPMPGIGPNGRRGASAEPPAKNLNDAFSKAGNDREMWKEISTANLIGGGAIQ
jgi:hypothetical protein